MKSLEKFSAVAAHCVCVVGQSLIVRGIIELTKNKPLAVGICMVVYSVSLLVYLGYWELLEISINTKKEQDNDKNS